ncbi:hypothetical protein HPB48_018727 [Haemaphysalis longicornis]|uniref:Uncharacterized protein n=1 Tax=Haemaphysalis longicornis TaxID=44386 RepID=A0A9J6GLT0_HAELO|nr:hypothetical protein HPB48_018727 [Haemaphysalis longicornis]
MAVGCHGRVANEAVQGDVGWSSFAAQEASSKLAFYNHLLNMHRDRWARRVFELVGNLSSHAMDSADLPPGAKVRHHTRPHPGAISRSIRQGSATESERWKTRRGS